MEPITITARMYEQLPADDLVRQTLERKEGVLAANGALCVTTGVFTGRSPEDKFIVLDEITKSSVDWGRFNQPIEERHFVTLRKKMTDHLNEQSQVWVRKMRACADPAYRMAIHVITETPWANLFAANLFIEPEKGELVDKLPEWTILHAPGFLADPSVDGTRSANFTIISFSHQTILIGGTAYTGELKKAVFTVLNFMLPQSKQIMTMHCSATEGTEGDVALFFGLSGTGKTTLSADPERQLIGDDEHGWSETGIFNFEGGCYAKIINLSAEHEPDIYGALRAGAMIENTLPDTAGRIDFADCSITENTRASYPLLFIPRAKQPASGGHPKHIFFLTCDAYGVLPPLSRLDIQQALYYFINGYTAKVAGTEVGISEPKITFSACFGAPFLPLPPAQYAGLLSEKIEKHCVQVWLLNTGWTGGPYGTGERIRLRYTRAMVRAVLNGTIRQDYRRHPVFDLLMPSACPGVPGALLDPQKTWEDAEAYEQAAVHLARLFESNYSRFRIGTVTA